MSANGNAAKKHKITEEAAAHHVTLDVPPRSIYNKDLNSSKSRSKELIVEIEEE
jgi:hypothetical protein